MATHAVTFASFEETVDQNAFVILDFWAGWCGPCKIFAPLYEAVSEHFPDVYFGKVDTEAEKDLAAAFQIRSIPTLMAFRRGELIFEQAGVLPAAAFEDLIRRLKE